MNLPITERERLISAALRVIRADHYQPDDDPNADAEAEYADGRLATAARAYVAAIDAPAQHPNADSEPATDNPRAEFISALRELAVFLTDNPAVPIPSGRECLTVFPRGTDEQERAAVDAAAKVMGVIPVVNAENTHYRAVVAFGPLEFEVLAITAQEMTDYQERDRLGREAFEAQREAATASTGAAA